MTKKKWIWTGIFAIVLVSASLYSALLGLRAVMGSRRKYYKKAIDRTINVSKLWKDKKIEAIHYAAKEEKKSLWKVKQQAIAEGKNYYHKGQIYNHEYQTWYKGIIMGDKVWLGLSRRLEYYDKVKKVWSTKPLPYKFTIGGARLRMYCLADDSPYIWVGTDVGALRLNTNNGKWDRFTVENGLTSNHIKSIAVSKEHVWLGTDFWRDPTQKSMARSKYKGGISRYHKARHAWENYTVQNTGKAHTYGQKDGLSSNQVNALSLDKEGNLWVAMSEDWDAGNRMRVDKSITSKGGGVARFDGKKWVSFNSKDGLTSNNACSLFIDSGGNIWAGTYDNGVSLYNKRHEKWDSFTEKDGLGGREIRSIASDGEGNIYFRSDREHNLTKYDGDRFFIIGSDEGKLINNWIFAIDGDEDYLWVATQKGLSRLDKKNETWKTYFVKDGLADNQIRVIRCDGNLVWMGTRRGLTVFDKRDDRFATLTEKDGLAGDRVQCIELYGEEVWVGGFGVSKYDKVNKQWTKFISKNPRWGRKSNEANSGLVANNVSCLDVDGDYVWVGTGNPIGEHHGGSGIGRFNRITKKWDTFKSGRDGVKVTEEDRQILFSDGILAVKRDGDYLWASARRSSGCFGPGGGSAVSRYNIKTGKWFTYFVPRVKEIHPDGRVIWFGAGAVGFVYSFDKKTERWTKYTGIGSPVVVQDKYVWFRASGGVVRYNKKNGGWTRFTIADRRFPNYLLVSNSEIWLGVTNKGIYKIERDL